MVRSFGAPRLVIELQLPITQKVLGNLIIRIIFPDSSQQGLANELLRVLE
jgi:hypothetical protein